MKPEWALRLVAECDLAISHGAYRLLSRILSYRTRTSYKEDPFDPFPLTWAMVAKWCGCERRESYRRLGELVGRGYMHHEGVFGCPGQAHYRIVEAMAEGHFKKGSDRGARQGTPRSANLDTPRSANLDTPRSANLDTPRGAREESARGARKGPHHISNSLREEMKVPRGRNSSLRSEENEGGKVGSLRSKVGKKRLRQMAKQLAKLKATNFQAGT